MRLFMKKLLFAMLLLQSLSGFAYEKTEGICKTAGQKNPWIKIELFTASTTTEKTHAVKTEYNYNGTLVSTETIQGSEPDYNFTKATTENGDKLFIIDYMI